MKSKLTLLFLFFSILKSYTCSCSGERDFNSKDDLKNYEFIAHVKITNIENIELEGSYHSMSFNIIELYKGKPLKSIIVFGSNRLLKSSTSCDINENIGEEWIIFGYKSKGYEKLFTGFCTRSKKIKDFNGYENIKYANKLTLKKRLQILYDKIDDKVYNGKRVEYYKNGNKRLEENYENEELNGLRELWYPNGIKQSSQNYKDGLKNGVFKWYSKKGNLTKSEKFKKDIKRDTTNIYYKNGSQKNISDQYIYNEKGLLIYYAWYLTNGTKFQESIHNTKTKTSTKKHFDFNGNLERESITCEGKRVSEKEWNRLGEIIKIKIYDKNGVLIKENNE